MQQHLYILPIDFAMPVGNKRDLRVVMSRARKRKNKTPEPHSPLTYSLHLVLRCVLVDRFTSRKGRLKQSLPLVF